jgi:hypothetical protein
MRLTVSSKQFSAVHYRILIIAVLAMLMTGLATAQTTRYVTEAGNDSGTCETIGSACASIQFAVDQSGAGDLIRVDPGSYSEDVNVSESVEIAALTASNPPIIQGGFQLSANDITLRLLDIRGGAESFASETSGVYVIGGTSGHLVIDSLITGTGEPSSRGILVGIGVSDISVVDNVIDNWVTGIYINPTTAADILIDGNTISNNFAGVGGDHYSGVTISNNELVDNTEGIGYFYDENNPPGGTPSGPILVGNDFSGNETPVQAHGDADLDAEQIADDNTFDQPVVLVIPSGSLFHTIQPALDAASDGDTVVVPAGELFDLDEGEPLEFNNSGVTLTTDPGDPATIRYGHTDFFPVIEIFAVNAVIENLNIIRDNSGNAAQGIAVRQSGATIQNVNISGSNNANIAAITIDHGLPGEGYSSEVDNVLITGNNISGSFVWGIGVATRSLDGQIIGATISYNVIDGTDNGIFFFNDGGDENGIQNITYTDNSHLNLSGSVLLFQSFEVLDADQFLADNVTERWARALGGVGVFLSIQSAINSANDGDTVEVSAGTFIENLNFENTTGLAIQGAQAGVSAGVAGPRDATSTVDETIVVGQLQFGGGTPTVSDLTLDGLRLEATAMVNNGARINGNLVLRNLIVEATTTYFLITIGTGSGHSLELSDSTVTVERGFSIGNASVTSALIQGNVFNQTAASLISASALDGVAVIEGNILRVSPVRLSRAMFSIRRQQA